MENTGIDILFLTHYLVSNAQYSEEELEKEVEDTAAEFKSYNHEFDGDRIREQVSNC